jgi:hypothetical protein
MPEYTVTLTYIEENVEADSEEEAIERAAKRALTIGEPEDEREPYADYFNEKEANQTSDDEDEED